MFVEICKKVEIYKSEELQDGDDLDDDDNVNQVQSYILNKGYIWKELDK